MATDNGQALDIPICISLAEVLAIPGLVESNPVLAENYEQLVAWYQLPDGVTVTCCVQKPSGGLCREPHRFGYVVRLKDTTASLIGNCCARTKFAVDSNLSRDRIRYDNQRQRLSRLGRLAVMLETAGTMSERMDRTEQMLRSASKDMDALRVGLGSRACARLSDMAKRGSGTVTVRGITIREHVDRHGEVERERRSSLYAAGTLAGIEAFLPGALHALEESARHWRRMLQKAQAMPLSTGRIRTSEVESLVASLDRIDGIERDVLGYKSALQTFENSDLTPLCFVTGDRSTQYRLARLALGKMGQPDSRDRAKAWIAGLEARMKAAWGVHQVSLID